MSKMVQRIEQYGYAYRRSKLTGGLNGHRLWEVLVSADPDKYIALFGYDVQQKMVTVYEAWNLRDDGLKALKLRDMILSFWKQKTGLPIQELKVIKYDTVLENTMQPLLSAIDESICHSDSDSLMISVFGTSYEERRAYEALHIFGPFVNGAVKMLDEYAELSGRTIKSFEIQHSDYPSMVPGKGFHNLLIHLD
ncbi:hypothetical protein Daus18300_010603 [Diaporthe australafricana]|uniref:Uncharacterized protein n=1 Tax=Diaporthe australafricana TaxID=127596 RepID=A0ABR3W9R4_9PEZI